MTMVGCNATRAHNEPPKLHAGSLVEIVDISPGRETRDRRDQMHAIHRVYRSTIIEMFRGERQRT